MTKCLFWVKCSFKFWTLSRCSTDCPPLSPSETTRRLSASLTEWTAVTRCVSSAGPAARWGGRTVEETGRSRTSRAETADTPAAPSSPRTPPRGGRTATRVRAPSARPPGTQPTGWSRITTTTRTARRTRTTPPPSTTPPSPPAVLTGPCAGRSATARRTVGRTARCRCCWSPRTASSSSSSRGRRPGRGLCVWGGRSPGWPLTLLWGPQPGPVWTGPSPAWSAPTGRGWSASGRGRRLYTRKVPSGPSGTTHPNRYRPTLELLSSTVITVMEAWTECGYWSSLSISPLSSCR